MQTPHNLSLAEFIEARKQWVVGNCVTDGSYQRCRRCNNLIQIVGVCFSIHDARLPECAGGKVMRLVPFCSKCEPRPEEYSCFHEQSLNENPEKAIWN